MISLVITGDEFADGANSILQTLKKENVKASFFLTGRFYRNFQPVVKNLFLHGHYLGAHSDQHLLYCDWVKRDSLLVTKHEFISDLENNYRVMARYGIRQQDALYFLPPYEWYNDTISKWTKELGLQLVNFTPGTLSHADYTTVSDKNYRSSEVIHQSIMNYENSRASGLNGFILLVHIGSGPGRPDKFYNRLPQLIASLKVKGYQFVTIPELVSGKID